MNRIGEKIMHPISDDTWIVFLRFQDLFGFFPFFPYNASMLQKILTERLLTLL